MIDLYTAPTPNGWKASIALEELELPYTVHAIDLSKGEQKEPWYLELNPNGRIPTIVDREAGDFPVFESGAILLYLAEKAGRLLPADPKGRWVAVQWLMFQMGGVGPMMGQANVFYRYFPERIQPAIDRYQNESRRLFEVLDRRLRDREWLADEFSVADVANWAWTRTYKWSGVSMEGLDGLRAWHERMKARPACRRGVEVPYKLPNLTEEGDAEGGKRFAEDARKMVQR